MGTGFDLGLQGILAQNDQLAIIGNNLANSQTAGFKTERANFADLFASQSGLIGFGGGRFGAGVGVVGTVADWRTGDLSNTANPANVATDGEGFFAVRYPSSSENFYTRVGDFTLARAPSTVNGGSGYVLARPDGVMLCGCYNTSPTSTPTPASPDIAADGSINTAQNPVYFFAQKYDDGTLGHATAGWYEWDDTSWKASNGSVPSPTSFNIAGDGVITAKPSGSTPGSEKAGDTRIEFRISRTDNPKPMGSSGSVLLDAMTSARIGLERFGNPDALDRLEGGIYRSTPDAAPVATSTSAGAAKGGFVPNSNGCGGTLQGMLESSNVDVGKEMTNMIIAQRAFQANSKSITTNDQMLQTLLGLR